MGFTGGLPSLIRTQNGCPVLRSWKDLGNSIGDSHGCLVRTLVLAPFTNERCSCSAAVLRCCSHVGWGKEHPQPPQTVTPSRFPTSGGESSGDMESSEDEQAQQSGNMGPNAARPAGRPAGTWLNRFLYVRHVNRNHGLLGQYALADTVLLSAPLPPLGLGPRTEGGPWIGGMRFGPLWTAP